jgi:hypothetical protein
MGENRWRNEMKSVAELAKYIYIPPRGSIVAAVYILKVSRAAGSTKRDFLVIRLVGFAVVGEVLA